jgi:hypothetical protein
MGYTNNREFLPLTNEVNFYSDGCGETYDKKYYVNGAYIDLCGLTVKEYMTNPCCGGSGSGSGSEASKPKNKVRIVSYEEENAIFYQAISDYPVTSNIKIRVHNPDTDAITELDIFVGETKSQPEIGDSLTIKEVSVDVKEDDDFIYTPTIGGDPGDSDDAVHSVYVGTLHLNDAKNLTIDKIKTLSLFDMPAGSAMDVKFAIPATDIDTGDMEEDEFMKFCEENQYAFVIVLPKVVYENSAYSIFNYSTDITTKFVFDSSYVIDSSDFVCIMEKATDDIMPYVPLYKEELTYEYKLTMNK